MTRFSIATLFTLMASPLLWANDNLNEDTGNVQINPIVVVEPNEEVREQYEAQIDTEFFELGAYMGVLAIEDFGSSTVTGLKASFHATEDFFLQANYGQAEAGLSTAEYYFDNQTTSIIPDRNYEYYNLLVGYNLFPGETFITQNLTLNSTFYVVAGAGNTDFAGDNHFTLTFGSGYRIILTDWLTWNMDFRDHSFDTQIGAKEKRTHNLEFSLGLTAFF
ncbi:MAG: outer membrane beta-barrel domain-containing protein [Gammaproteobacteria bacterium]|nr:outer membrane beta-barrel domain-containing protein [Gammaproteobacteria bacterium]